MQKGPDFDPEIDPLIVPFFKIVPFLTPLKWDKLCQTAPNPIKRKNPESRMASGFFGVFIVC